MKISLQIYLNQILVTRFCYYLGEKIQSHLHLDTHLAEERIREEKINKDRKLFNLINDSRWVPRDPHMQLSRYTSICRGDGKERFPGGIMLIPDTYLPRHACMYEHTHKHV